MRPFFLGEEEKRKIKRFRGQGHIKIKLLFLRNSINTDAKSPGAYKNTRILKKVRG